MRGRRQRAVLVDRGVLHRGFPAGAAHRGEDRHLRQQVADVGPLARAAHLGEQRGESDEPVGAAAAVRNGVRPLPQPECVRERRGMRRLTVEEHALVRHEDVVEDEQALGHVRAVADREVPGVLTAGRVRGVDDRQALGVRRDRARHGVVLLARLHALGREHHLLVDERSAGDVHLRSARSRCRRSRRSTTRT